jgi:hypothetical protein
MAITRKFKRTFIPFLEITRVELFEWSIGNKPRDISRPSLWFIFLFHVLRCPSFLVLFSFSCFRWLSFRVLFLRVQETLFVLLSACLFSYIHASLPWSSRHFEWRGTKDGISNSLLLLLVYSLNRKIAGDTWSHDMKEKSFLVEEKTWTEWKR